MHMQGWRLGTLEEDSQTVKSLSIIPEQMNQVVGAYLSLPEIEDEIIYFIAPPGYKGNQLTAYGGTLNYTIFYTTTGTTGNKLRVIKSSDLCTIRGVLIHINEIFLIL